MLLTVLERLTLLNILPKEDRLTTMRVVHELRQRVGFSEAELAELQFVEAEGRLSWTDIPAIEIEIGPKAKQIVREALQALDAAKKLTEHHVSLWDKFECVEGAA